MAKYLSLEAEGKLATPLYPKNPMKAARIDTVLDQLTLSLGPALAGRASGNADTAAVIASALGLPFL